MDDELIIDDHLAVKIACDLLTIWFFKYEK